MWLCFCGFLSCVLIIINTNSKVFHFVNKYFQTEQNQSEITSISGILGSIITAVYVYTATKDYNFLFFSQNTYFTPFSQLGSQRSQPSTYMIVKKYSILTNSYNFSYLVTPRKNMKSTYLNLASKTS